MDFIICLILEIIFLSMYSLFLLEDSIKSCVIRDCFKELLETIPGRTINSIHTDNGS